VTDRIDLDRAPRPRPPGPNYSDVNSIFVAAGGSAEGLAQMRHRLWGPPGPTAHEGTLAIIPLRYMSHSNGSSTRSG
jgi:hypothetical protein